MKDFFDVWLLSEMRRRTRIDIEPVCFADRFAQDPAKSKQWTAFLRRSLLVNAPTAFPEIIARLKLFLQPVTVALEKGESFDWRWERGGDWQESPAK